MNPHAKLDKKVTYSKVVYLPTTNGEQNDGLNDGPPLHPVIRRFGCVTMHLLTNDNILLLILHSCQPGSKLPNLPLNRCNNVWNAPMQSERAHFQK